MKSLTSIAVLVVAYFGFLGCQSPGGEDMVKKQLDIDRMTEDLARGGAEDLSTGQLRATCGEPQQTMRVSQFATLLASPSEEKGAWGDVQMASVFSKYRAQLAIRGETRDSSPNWRASRRFNECRIWLYRWSNPQEMISESGWPFSERGHHRISFYFLIEDDKVLTTGWIERPPEERAK